MSIVKHLIDVVQGKHPITARRSGSWPRVRAEHLKRNPACAVCGGKDKLEVHHKQPFCLRPELELDPDNLITLCESGKGGVSCHLFVGHLGNFKAFNPDVEADAAEWCKKIQSRPVALSPT